MKRNKKQTTTQELEILSDVEQEIEDALYFCIHSGFYSKDEIYSQAHQIFEDVCMDNDVMCPSGMYRIQKLESLILDFNSIEKGGDNYVESTIAVDFAGYTLDDGFEELGIVCQFMKNNNIPRRGYCFYDQQDIERAMDGSIRSLFPAFHSRNGDKQIATKY